MMRFSIEMIGEERFIRGFSRISSEIQDFEPAFRVILGDFRETEQRIFATEGASEGERFPPLSRAYAEWKDTHYPGQPLMWLEGDLAFSLMGRARGTIEEINKTEARFGTEIPYAHRHQMGTQGMPQRKIVQVNEKTKRRWGRIFARHAMGLFEKYGIQTYTDYVEAF